jgi:hypothetical protein
MFVCLVVCCAENNGISLTGTVAEKKTSLRLWLVLPSRRKKKAMASTLTFLRLFYAKNNLQRLSNYIPIHCFLLYFLSLVQAFTELLVIEEMLWFQN